MDSSLFIRAFLTLCMLALLGYALWWVPQIELGAEQQRIVDLLTGAIIAQTSLAMGWWFASSKGSSDKTALMAPGLDPALQELLTNIQERLEVQSAALEVRNQEVDA